MRSVLLLNSCLLALPIVVGCGGSRSSDSTGGVPRAEVAPFEGEGPVEIVCTTGMVADIVRNVGGEHVKAVHVGDETFDGEGERLVVRQLFGSGVDPHTHRPTPSDVEHLSQADLIVYSGLHLEGKLTEVLDRMARRKPTYAVTSELPPERLLVDESQSDPHVWMDVSLWSESAGHVADLLAKLDPDRADDYAANLADYRTQLDELHAYVERRVSLVPEEHRVLVTAHDAFAYFAEAYGMEVKSIQGISTESEASVQDVNELVEFLVSRGLKAVFVESSVSDRNVRSLVEGCASHGHEVVVGGELFSDAMGRPGTTEGTYAGMIRHNVDTIVEALR